MHSHFTHEAGGNFSSWGRKKKKKKKVFKMCVSKTGKPSSFSAIAIYHYIPDCKPQLGELDAKNPKAPAGKTAQ